MTGQAELPTERVQTAARILLRTQRVLERAQTELSLPQYRILALVEAGGDRSARLADKLSVRRPTLTALADGLVAAGYLTRDTEPGDRRVVRLQITEAGRAALSAADAAFEATLRPLLGECGDPERLIDLLCELDAALEARARAHRQSSRTLVGSA